MTTHIAKDNANAVAIVGMAVRVPGAADPHAYWENLIRGKESISALSRDLLAHAGVSAQTLSLQSFVGSAGRLENIEQFDAGFFGFTPREAELTDPQLRLLLMLAVHAIEDAGYSPRGLATTGVYFGVNRSSYFLNNLLPDERLMRIHSQQIAFGNDKDYAATLVAHRLDLRGPCMTIATACSTSLVTVHQACRGLVGFECDVALAGGANVNVLQDAGYHYREGGILSPDGHCRAFDAKGQGTVFGSGAGVVVLKRLDDALRDGDTVHGVILGSAVNNDGSQKVGFTAPSVRGQADVIFEAQAVAGVSARSIGLIEAHGTGTLLGDPIEVAALREVFEAAGAERGACALGSVKTNVGHLDSAAGIAGLIKAVLALRHRQIPPSLHFEQPNPQIDFEHSPFYVPVSAREWPQPADGGYRRAGVSAFGIGGTNAHVVLEEAPAQMEEEAPVRAAQMFVLSARSEAAARRSAMELARHLRAHTQLGPASVANTLQRGRARYGYRVSVVARDLEGAAAQLEQAPVVQAHGGAEVAFLFPGQGSQYAGMLGELYRDEEVFRTTLEQCLEVLGPVGDELREMIVSPAPDASARLAQTRLTQPALFAVSYALAQQWQAWGVRPVALLGHSVGEYVAACLAGVFSLKDALWLVAERGRLMQGVPGGAMLAVGLGEAEVMALLEPGVELAAVNGASQCVVSGVLPAIQALQARLTGQGVRVQALPGSHAFHSSMMEPVLEAFAQRVSAVRRQAPARRILSNVTGDWMTAQQAQDPAYWARHLREPVRFHDGLARLFAEPGLLLLEVGPGQVVSGLARRHAGSDGRVVASCRAAGSARADGEILLEAAGRLWTGGYELDWDGLAGGRHSRRVSLPGYPFELQRFWVEPPQRTGVPAQPSSRESADEARLYQPVWVPQAKATVHHDAPISRDLMIPKSADEPPQEVLAASYNHGRPTAESAGTSNSVGDVSVPLGRTVGEIRAAILSIWIGLLGHHDIKDDDNFFDRGGSSLLLIELAARVGRSFGIRLSSQDALSALTIGEQTALVASRMNVSAVEAVHPPYVTLANGESDQATLFLIHPIGGTLTLYRNLVRNLAGYVKVIGIHSVGLAAGVSPHTTVEQIAASYVGILRDAEPRGPYLLVGASFGGLIAFEMARLLIEQGASIRLLCMIDSPAPGPSSAPSYATERDALLNAILNVEAESRDLIRSEPDLSELPTEHLYDLYLERQKQSGVLEDAAGHDDLKRHFDVYQANLAAMQAYAPAPLAVELLYFQATQVKVTLVPHNAANVWASLALRGVQLHQTPGDHATMLAAPNVQHLSTVLLNQLVAGESNGGYNSAIQDI